MPIIPLINGLNSTHQKGTLERVLKWYARYELLIIDAISYLPIEGNDASLLFDYSILDMKVTHPLSRPI